MKAALLQGEVKVLAKGGRSPVFGVGINDYPGTSSWMEGGVRYLCPFYVKWRSMLSRCYNKKYLDIMPTYTGCYVTEDWKKFSVFRAWMEGQDWEGKHLDKDLLVKGNKKYGPDTCVFISGKLNTFLNDHGLSRGEHPLGVSWHKGRAKFVAQCSNPETGKSVHLGLFDDPDEAHLAWKRRKHELACIYADQQTDPRVADALRIRYLH